MSITIAITKLTYNPVFSLVASATIPGVGVQSLTYNSFASQKALTPTSTPPVTKAYVNEITGNCTLDLTALADPLAGTIDGTGLKVQALRLVNNATGTSAPVLTVAANSTTGYALNGLGSLQVPAGGDLMIFFADKLDDVSGTKKLIDFTLAAGETFQIMIGLG